MWGIEIRISKATHLGVINSVHNNLARPRFTILIKLAIHLTTKNNIAQLHTFFCVTGFNIHILQSKPS